MSLRMILWCEGEPLLTQSTSGIPNIRREGRRGASLVCRSKGGTHDHRRENFVPKDGDRQQQIQGG